MTKDQALVWKIRSAFAAEARGEDVSTKDKTLQRLTAMMGYLELGKIIDEERSRVEMRTPLMRFGVPN